MNKCFRVWLRPGEKIYINGAVLRADRKVSLEFLNDVTFLLESHVLQPSQTTTPLRQLYFTIQTMLIAPTSAQAAQGMFTHMHARLMETFDNKEVLEGLRQTGELMRTDRWFEALKLVRSFFPLEEKLLHPAKAGPSGAHRQIEAAPCE
jgi:flagellar biosynthesis repressor protein FlbT